ncbi:uncharacterized protein LAJ45_07564 [Morchella importuna]|uniref:uncharacterized protein n=1 Tax=Morchella importuna TaxID=1174673 RepID=UPI001E8EB563|nr:uncharacterized protein LAJ45_07564 [Morchella importuna]KAH8148461.1 hypothetical protein LAJ45_07564 [Morchella importuna]
MKKEPENCQLLYRNGLTISDETMSLKWLERNYGPDSKTAEKAGNDFWLLLFDGHTSHVNTSFLIVSITV